MLLVRSSLPCCCLVLLVHLAVGAQDKSEEKGSTKKPRGPLPTYFGQIGASDQQREELYKVQDEYEARLEALRQQLKALIAERDAKMESLLTPGQKLRLDELRQAAQKKPAPGTPAVKKPE